jgi:hypothetical protein
MKALAWILPVAAILVFALWWRECDIQDELSQLRMEAAVSRAVASSHSPPMKDSDSPINLAPSGVAHSRAGIPIVPSVELPPAERVAELERIVAAQTTVIEKMTAQMEALDLQRQRATARSWGPEQATGAPDTSSAGDYRTAWAPAQADGGVEWLEATFEKPAEVAQLIVRQTSNPGAITKIVSVTETGTEIPIWAGQDPSKGQPLSDTPFAFPSGVTTGRVRVYLDTTKLPGWEEIDALQLVGRDGSRQWAKSVNASSTYAGGNNTSFSAFTLEAQGNGLMLIER